MRQPADKDRVIARNSANSSAVAAVTTLLIALAICGRAIYFLTPVNSDTAMFVYAGKLVASGGRPGIDLIDNKLPSVGLLMAVPERLIGAYWPGYGLLGLAMSLAASLSLWRTADRWLGGSTGIIVGVASAVWLNFTPAVYGQLQLETIEIFFAALSAGCVAEWLARKDWRDALAAGLCGGMAMWAKPTAAAILVAAGVTMVFAARSTWRQRSAGVVALICGAISPLIICLWLIVVTGMGDALPATLRQLHDYAANSNLDWIDAAKPIFVVAVLLFPLLIIGFICRREKVFAAPRPSGLAFFVVVWFACELAGVISQRRMYAYHFMVLGPAAALLCGLPARKLRGRMLLMAFGPAAAVAFVWAASMLPTIDTPTRDSKLIAYAKTSASPGETIWVDDYPRLLMEANLKPGSAVPLIFLFANSDAAPDFFGTKILEDFAERRPAMIILPADIDRLIDLYHHHMADVAGSPLRAAAMERNVRAIDAYVREHYEPVENIDGLTVFRAKCRPLDAVTAVNRCDQ